MPDAPGDEMRAICAVCYHALDDCQCARATDTPAETRLTRVEVIDHRAVTDTFGRAFVAWDVAVTLSYQDDGRTLKVFVDDAAAPVQGEP